MGERTTKQAAELLTGDVDILVFSSSVYVYGAEGT